MTDAIGVTVGGSHACAWTSNGTVKCWGETLRAVPVHPELTADPPDSCFRNPWWVGMPAPVTVVANRVPGIPPAVLVAAGTNSTCALDVHGSAHCWNPNDPPVAGQSPIRVIKLERPMVELLRLPLDSWDHPDPICAVDDADQVACWGGKYGDAPLVMR
jgi:hypothetical protein